MDLVDLGLWNEDLKNEIMRHNGSIQEIEGIPANIKELYKTVWELGMKDIIDMAADRGMFIDQSQKYESVHAVAQQREADQHAYVCLGSGAEDRAVLSPNEERDRRDQVHRGKASQKSGDTGRGN